MRYLQAEIKLALIGQEYWSSNRTWTTAFASISISRSNIFEWVASRIPSRIPQSFAWKLVVWPKFFAKPVTQFPCVSRITPPAPEFLSVPLTEPSVLSLNSPAAGSFHLTIMVVGVGFAMAEGKLLINSAVWLLLRGWSLEGWMSFEIQVCYGPAINPKQWTQKGISRAVMEQ